MIRKRLLIIFFIKCIGNAAEGFIGQGFGQQLDVPRHL